MTARGCRHWRSRPGPAQSDLRDTQSGTSLRTPASPPPANPGSGRERSLPPDLRVATREGTPLATPTTCSSASPPTASRKRPRARRLVGHRLLDRPAGRHAPTLARATRAETRAPTTRGSLAVWDCPPGVHEADHRRRRPGIIPSRDFGLLQVRRPPHTCPHSSALRAPYTTENRGVSRSNRPASQVGDLVYRRGCNDRGRPTVAAPLHSVSSSTGRTRAGISFKPASTAAR